MMLKFPYILVQSIVFRVLASLGISFITYYGFSGLMGTVMGQIQSYIFGNISPLGHSSGNPDGLYAALKLMGLFGVDKAINLLLSAYSARVAMVSMKKFMMG